MKHLIAAVTAGLLLASPAFAAAPSLAATKAAMLGKWHDNGDDPGTYWEFHADGTCLMGGDKEHWLLFSGAKPPKEATPDAIDTPDPATIYLEMQDPGAGLLFYTVDSVTKKDMALTYIHGAGNGMHDFTRVAK